jgi:dienelactone hydrolase
MTIPSSRLVCGLFVLVGSWLPAADLSDQRMEALFRPFLAEQVTLSHDGRYIAYSDHSGTDVTVKIVDLDQPGSPRTVLVQEDRVVDNASERQRASLRFLRWAEGNRLVFAPSVYSLPRVMSATSVSPEVTALGFSPPAPRVIAPIMAVDADGGNPRTLVQSEDFQELLDIGVDGAPPDMTMRRNQILGFAAGKRDRLLVALPPVAAPAEDRVIPSGVFEINVRNGAMIRINEDGAFGTKSYDRWGQPRLMTEDPQGRRYERTYSYRMSGVGGWRSLARGKGEADLSDFALNPLNYYGERSIPLGFGFERDVLIYGSNVGRDTYGVYGLDLKTMSRVSLAVEHPGRDLVHLSPSTNAENLVLDEARQALVGIRAFGAPPFTIWLDPELADAQRAFDFQFPRRSVEMVEWNDARTRFLLRVSGGTEPGRLYVFKRPEGVLTEISRRAPWLANANLHDTRPVAFAGPDGATLTGYLTKPRAPRDPRMPLVIVFASGFPATPHAEFDREAQVLAEMGLAVLRLNQRGVVGRGRAQLEALREGADVAALADVRAAIDWVAAHLPIERKRVVAMGREFAGYLALRVAQLEPALFRCVVATEPVVEPAMLTRPAADFNAQVTFSQEANRHFLETYAPALYKRGVVSSDDPIYHPTFVIYRNYLANSMTQGVARLRGQLKRRDIPFETIDVRQDYLNGMPKARGRVYRELQDFLNLNLYEYEVKFGPARVDS